MKKDVANYITRCMERHKVNSKHRHLARSLQSFPILEWKWELVTIDSITKLPKTTRQHDSITLVVNNLTKFPHFILVKMSQKATKIAEIYMQEIDRLQRMTKEIMSARDPKFTSNFWKGLFKGFGRNLNFSTSDHLESNGKIEMINEIIEDMLRMHVMDKISKWEDYII
jgi:hypothetical protein